MERLPMDSLRNILHTWILQHHIRMAWSNLFHDPSGDGNLRRRQRLLQQLLRTWAAIPSDRQHTWMVTQEGSPTMVVKQVVQKRFSPVLHVLLHSDDMANRSGGKWYRITSPDNSPIMDIQCTLALGISNRDRPLEGTICLWSLWHYANLPYRRSNTHHHLSPSHMVRLLPYGKHDTNDL